MKAVETLAKGSCSQSIFHSPKLPLVFLHVYLDRIIVHVFYFLKYTILFYTILHCTALHYTILYYTALYCTTCILQYTIYNTLTYFVLTFFLHTTKAFHILKLANVGILTSLL